MDAREITGDFRSARRRNSDKRPDRKPFEPACNWKREFDHVVSADAGFSNPITVVWSPKCPTPESEYTLFELKDGTDVKKEAQYSFKKLKTDAQEKREDWEKYLPISAKHSTFVYLPLVVIKMMIQSIKMSKCN